ncbi:MAG: hypothetical protein VBE63_25015 [Lamprobacter sp.]|uniref:hypothetical protein n=1 Tax=Lamprobacter sp. TaxID=3100796 RepID=UPI002B25BF1C|nr:hypothetical protein [Lamprobacter sp.]MEA3643173.1 hypothetical protein [Lamprobacter sp.]
MTYTRERRSHVEAPDPILAELWDVKREINKSADYRIDILVDMANKAAEQVQAQWLQQAHPADALKARAADLQR